jgi:hypothetical protein
VPSYVLLAEDRTCVPAPCVRVICGVVCRFAPAEQTEYTREEIEWSSIEFEDNKDCLDLIEATKPPGVLCLIDEACLVQVRGAPAGCVSLGPRAASRRRERSSSCP